MPVVSFIDIYHSINYRINRLINPNYGEYVVVLSKLLNSVEADPMLFYENINQSKNRLYRSLKVHHDEITSKLLVIKILNLIVLKYEIARCYETVSAMPFGLLIDASNSCTCACPGCVHSMTAKHLFDWPNGNLSNDIYSDFLNKFGPYATNIGFFNYGEPFVNKLTPKFVSQAKSLDLQTSISSNLSLRIDAEEIVLSGLDYLLLSIDGLHQKTYETYRRKGDIETVLQNIKKLVAAKKKLKYETPFITWQYLVFEHNKHEVEDAKEMAGTLGINQFFTAKPFEVTWDDNSIKVARDINYETTNFPITHETRKREKSLNCEIIDSIYNKLNYHCSKTCPDNKKMECKCEWLYKGTVADAHGRIIPCCSAPSPERKLVFSYVSDEDPYNSSCYRASRNFFAGRSYDCSQDTFCFKCDFNKDTLFAKPDNIKNYFTSNGYLTALNNQTLNQLVMSTSTK
jgi:pyruvate-formate lyase-activating enzyme